MKYQQIVEVIQREINEVKDIPVYFNDNEANYRGSAYFGVGDHVYDIVPEEELDNPMFLPEDFMTNEHLKYFHVGLPSVLLPKDEQLMHNYFQYEWINRNICIPITTEIMDLFIILHEFGHGHDLHVYCKKDIDIYLSERTERYNRPTKTLKELLAYKQLKTEQYADNFAFKYLEQIYAICKKENIILQC